MAWKKQWMGGGAGADKITPGLIARHAAPDPLQVKIVLENLLSDLPQERLEAIAKQIGWWKVSTTDDET